MALSNRTLFLNRTTEVYTVRDVLGERKGWVAGKRYWMRSTWGYVRDVDSSKGGGNLLPKGTLLVSGIFVAFRVQTGAPVQERSGRWFPDHWDVANAPYGGHPFRSAALVAGFPKTKKGGSGSRDLCALPI